MRTKILLERTYFNTTEKIIAANAAFTIKLFRYPSGVEAIELANERGRVIVLPYMGQIVWYAEFDGINLTMKNMFAQPKKAANIIDTYGCFAFHSGLLANGCPAAEDTHPMHGEFCCADMDKTWLEIGTDSVTVYSEYEYCQGFGYHYIARPSVTLKAKATKIDIAMQLKNLTGTAMPLQYMCHINHAYVDKGEFSTNIPDSAFSLRETIPSHIKPTQEWFAYTAEIKKLQTAGQTLTKLAEPDLYNTEVVLLAKHIDAYTDTLVSEVASPDGYAFQTKFSTKEFTHLTRWIMHTADQQVTAFAIPCTCTPEGFNAAKQAGTLIMLEAQAEKTFMVTTGLK